jgi:DNA polymerase III subunit epsilon
MFEASRQIIVDTETTGLDPIDGHRIVEIGCIEVANYLPTGAYYHVYINPERSMPITAYNVHGLSDEFLADKPRFSEIAGEFLDFIKDAPLVIHNAIFDMKFINFELAQAQLDPIPDNRSIDTLYLARQKFPGAPNSLDALCRRFEIDATGRQKHGALIDAELLAEVYLELEGGRQQGFELKAETAISQNRQNKNGTALGFKPILKQATSKERQQHDEFISEKIGEDALWSKLTKSQNQD